MNQVFLNPMMYEVFKRQHEELIQQAAQYRQWNEVRHTTASIEENNSNFMAQVGIKLSKLGVSLVARFGTTAEFHSSLKQQNNPGDCN